MKFEKSDVSFNQASVFINFILFGFWFSNKMLKITLKKKMFTLMYCVYSRNLDDEQLIKESKV